MQNSRGQEAWTRRQLVGAAGAALAAARPDLAVPLLQELAATLHSDLTQQVMHLYEQSIKYKYLLLEKRFLNFSVYIGYLRL